MIRNMTLNMLLKIRGQYDKSARVVICSDSSSGSWRRDYFPNYKCRRRKARVESDVDWPAIHASMDNIRREIAEHFPYTHIQIEGCEADDIIGVLTQHIQFINFEDTNGSPLHIISGDKDFKQLHRYPNVHQSDPIRGKISCDDPEAFLIDHIIRGDKDDDIPNILSDDDTFAVEGKRQVPMTKKRLDELEGIQNTPNHKYYQNYIRNKTLIDLNETPKRLRDEILLAYEDGPITDNTSKLYEYMMVHRLGNLVSKITDF